MTEELEKLRTAFNNAAEAFSKEIVRTKTEKYHCFALGVRTGGGDCSGEDIEESFFIRTGQGKAIAFSCLFAARQNNDLILFFKTIAKVLNNSKALKELDEAAQAMEEVGIVKRMRIEEDNR